MSEQEPDQIDMMNENELRAEFRKVLIELFAMTQRAEAAEARIKALHEQKPVACRARLVGQTDKQWVLHPVEFGKGCSHIKDLEVEFLTTAPVIPPDIAELQRENAELTRKLAEQQAYLDAYEAPEFLSEFGREELTKLLAEAKSEAVPEGWKLVLDVQTDFDYIDQAQRRI